MSKGRRTAGDIDQQTGAVETVTPSKPERKARKDGKPHPPEGMRYNKAGEIVPKIPPEMRGYYLLIGLSRRTGTPQIVSRFKSSLAATRYAEGSKNLLMEAYSAVSINRVRLYANVFGQ